MFKEITNRDAWSTIRGFVYQVDITILRWLNLKENEILELEKGEDIDIINDGLKDEEKSRILEQVKYREATTSLNTELAIELLFNFFLHKKNNPKQKLLFRFVSNAGYTKERPSLFPKGKSAIEVWQEIFKEDNVSPTDSRVQIIKTFLKKKIDTKLTELPKTIKKELEIIQNWIDFKTLILNPNEIVLFIKDFEWSDISPASDKISQEVKNAISASIHFEANTNIEELYPRLFLYVFKLLTNNSTKRLDILQLKSQSNLSALSPTDNTTYDLITSLLNSINGRVSRIENSMATSFKQIATLTEDLLEIKNSDTVFEVRLRNLSSTIPSEIQKGSLRNVKTNEVFVLFEEINWINFQGINGTGKTQLAVLSSKLFKNIHWIELREYNNSPEKSTLFIESLLSNMSGVPVLIDRRAWLINVLDNLPENSIIVINDLPQINNNSPLKELLVLLVENLTKRNLRLLTTSNYKVPTSINSLLDSGSFYEYYDFDFNDNEIQELLVNNGAPEKVLKHIDLFASVSQRNPQILAAIVSRMIYINWGKDSTELFVELFTKEFSKEILKDAQTSIASFISDGEMRELLYRLTLIHWNYTFDIVLAVSDVEVKINAPFEKLQGIANTWIEETGDYYKTSPLIHNLGLKNLNKETTKSTYSAIAKSILSSKNVNVITATRIITSYINAEEYNSAAIILFNLLRSAESIDSANVLYDWGYLDYWNSLDMPVNMAIILKSHITAEQIRLRKLIGKENILLTERLQKIVNEADDITEKLLTYVIILVNDLTTNPYQHLHSIKYILENISYLQQPLQEAINNDLLEGFLFMPIQKITTDDQVTLWLQLVEIYESKTNSTFFTNEITETLITVLVEHIVRYEKEQVDFTITSLFMRLDKLIEYFFSKNFEVLTAVILKERIALEYMALNDSRNAEKMTMEWNERFSILEAKYLLYENIGKLYFNDTKNPKNVAWLAQAIECNCEKHITFADTLAYGAASISDSNSGCAVLYMERAVELTKNMPWSSDLDNVQMICELGIAYWKNGDSFKSYITFSDALNILLAIKEEKIGPNWIRLLSWMAHTVGYISAEVAKDKVPTHFRDESEYIIPYQGIFLFNTKDLTDLYLIKKDILLLVQMAIFAEGVGDIKGSYKWSIHAYDEARKIGDKNLILMVSIECSQYLLINFKFEEYFEMALQFHALSANLSGTPEQKYEMASEVSFEEILLKRPSKEWDGAEETLFSLSILPMFIMVLNSYNSSNTNWSEYAKLLLQIIKDYVEVASDKLLWENAEDLFRKIFEKNVPANKLIAEANTYGEKDNKNFQSVCILGYVFLEKNNTEGLKQIINVFPHLTKIFSNVPAIFRNILIPFVRYYALETVKENYVGSKEEFIEITNQIEAATISVPNAVQKVLQIAVEISEMKIQGDRKDWLIDYKEI